MKLHDFIWSKKNPTKFYRHLTFWLAVYVFFILSVWIATLTMADVAWQELFPRFRGRFFILIACALYTYTTAYYLLPKYLYRQKYFSFLLWMIALTLMAFVLTGWVMFSSSEVLRKSSLLYAGWIHTMNFIFIGPPVICSLFLACKMLKGYFEKMEEKVTLVKENANAELQLLKAQVHPHFLFNTLNNIYSFTLSKSPRASGLVNKLSDMLKYMITECEHSLVPLEKELKVLGDYMDLEKVRYGSRLKLNVEIKGNPKHKHIAPLLLIPFVENSFKHGSSKMLDHPWIRLQITIVQNALYFNLTNSKPEYVDKCNGGNGIGLRNVRKRLQLLYPLQHELGIKETADLYSVQLKLPVHVMEKAQLQVTALMENG